MVFLSLVKTKTVWVEVMTGEKMRSCKNLSKKHLRRQSFSGLISQFNIWNASLEDFHIENMAECRSDAWGNAFAWKESLYSLGSEYSEVRKNNLYLS